MRMLLSVLTIAMVSNAFASEKKPQQILKNDRKISSVSNEPISIRCSAFNSSGKIVGIEVELDRRERITTLLELKGKDEAAIDVDDISAVSRYLLKTADGAIEIFGLRYLDAGSNNNFDLFYSRSNNPKSYIQTGGAEKANSKISCKLL